jgi:hypothetical protein
VPVSAAVHPTTGSKHVTADSEVGQLPALTTLVDGLSIVCTVNDYGHSNLTTLMGIANGSRGTVVCSLYAPGTGHPDLPTVVIVDFPEYRGEPICPNWPPTWVAVAPVQRLCENKCCKRTGILSLQARTSPRSKRRASRSGGASLCASSSCTATVS